MSFFVGSRPKPCSQDKVRTSEQMSFFLFGLESTQLARQVQQMSEPDIWLTNSDTGPDSRHVSGVSEVSKRTGNPRNPETGPPSSNRGQLNTNTLLYRVFIKGRTSSRG